LGRQLADFEHGRQLEPAVLKAELGSEVIAKSSACPNQVILGREKDLVLEQAARLK